MIRKYSVIFFFVLAVLSGKAQIGGETTYQFLELTNSARIAALGGNQVALDDTTDLNLPFHNPALLHKAMSNSLLANYVKYFADINFGYASFAKEFGKTGNFAVGMHYINYGNFKEATETGELTGHFFNASEYALNIIYSNHYKRFYYGVNLKPVFSVFESYRSSGLAGDAGLCYLSRDSLLRVGLVIRNMGGQITTYYEDGVKEPIPFNLQAGFSRRLKYAPVVFAITMQYLNKWDLSWSQTEEENSLEDFANPQETVFKQVLRHAVFGIEVLPTENFILRAGYNYQRRQELKFDERLSTVGFSLGIGLKIKRFRFDFATSRFHLAGSSNLFSLAINLNNSF